MSSLTRRLQIRLMKKRDNVEKVPCPYGRVYDTGLIDDTGTPLMAPVMVWPRFLPKKVANEAV